MTSTTAPAKSKLGPLKRVASSGEVRVLLRIAQVTILVFASAVLIENCEGDVQGSANGRPNIAMLSSVLNESFDGSAEPLGSVKGWTAGPDWNIGGGVLSYQGTAEAAAILAGSPTDGERRLVATAKISALNGAGGLILGRVNENSYWRVVYSAPLAGLVVEQIVVGQPRQVATMAPVGAPENMTLTVEIRHNALTVYVETERVITAKYVQPADNAPTTFGLFAQSGPVSFDDVYFGAGD